MQVLFWVVWGIFYKTVKEALFLHMTYNKESHDMARYVWTREETEVFKKYYKGF